MGQKFVPVELQLIDQGRFIGQFKTDLHQLQADFINYCRKHLEKAKGAKAKLVAEIIISAEDDKANMFGIKAGVRTSLPAAPPSVGVAMAADDDGDVPTLFCHIGGTKADSPEQGVMFGDQGEKLQAAQVNDDTADGEV